MSSILVNTQASDQQDSGASWAPVPGLGAASITVESASDVILLIATIPSIMAGGSSDRAAWFRFAIDGTREGPEGQARYDNANEACGMSLCYATTLSPGTHEFRLEWITDAGGTSTDYRTLGERSMQVIEITDASLIVNQVATDQADATSSYADIADLVASPTVTTGAVHIILANWFQDDESDASGDTKFQIADGDVGYRLATFSDASGESCAYSGMWVADGLTGAQEFAMQWLEKESNTRHRSTFERRLQVIEITANVNKLVEQVSSASGSLGGAYADVGGLVASGITVDGTDSILLAMAGIKPNGQSGDDTGEFRHGFDGAEEGPLVHVFHDGGTVNDHCGHSVYWVSTGKSAGTHAFSLRGINRTGDFVFDATQNARGIAVVELLVGVFDQTLTPGPVSAAWSVPVPTLLSPKTLTPAATVASWGVPAVTVVHTLTPVPTTATWGVPAPTVATGPVTLTPAPSAASWAVPAPTIIITLTPAAAVANWLAPAPTISTGQTILPGPAVATWDVPAPTVSPGPVTLTPVPTAAAWAVPAPTLQPGAVTLTPAATISNWAVPAPTVLSQLTLQPVPGVANWLAPAPILSVGPVTLLPSPAAANWVAPVPTVVVGAVTLTPGAVSASWSVPAPTIVIPSVGAGESSFEEPDRGSSLFKEPDAGVSGFTERTQEG